MYVMPMANLGLPKPRGARHNCASLNWSIVRNVSVCTCHVMH